MLVKTFGSTLIGIDAITITVEADVGRGAKFYLVGLPDNAVKESQQRIYAALANNGYRWPGGKGITVNPYPFGGSELREDILRWQPQCIVPRESDFITV